MPAQTPPAYPPPPSLSQALDELAAVQARHDVLQARLAGLICRLGLGPGLALGRVTVPHRGLRRSGRR